MAADPPNDWTPTFDEAPLDEVLRQLETLIASGRVAIERATGEDLANARVPAAAGAAFLSLARAYRRVVLLESEVAIELHDGEEAPDELGGWRLRADPDFLDIRLAPLGAMAAQIHGAGDIVVDASWSPRGEEICVHSTFAHFLVRAVVGDG
jgi:hypothetical protein